MPLTPVDRALLQRCLHHEPGAWNDFVDRYLGLIYHVVRHTSHLRSIPLGPEDVEDVAAEVLLQLVANDYAVFKQFRGLSSLATYLTVIARRICIQELVKRTGVPETTHAKLDGQRAVPSREEPPKAQVGLESLEEVQQLLRKLPTRERQVVRLFYFEGRSYEEISTALHIPVNSIGPILSRARKKLRKDVKGAPPVKQNQPKSD
ncbi:MAG TPA: sigma-70 family RNA polymerase sigma factor [Gemmataceae bacterium]|nr:sigma-70 family RNA polymerase sigma factor [Gemmataceae bacterium]